jgi:site-specific DNA recombinase
LRKTAGSLAPRSRPNGTDSALQLAEARLYSILLVWKFDRLARNLFDLMEKYNVVLRSVTEPIDTSNPIGEMIASVRATHLSPGGIFVI